MQQIRGVEKYLNTTRALTSADELQAYMRELQKSHDYRFHLLAVVGISTGFRVSDLLKLKYGDFSKNKTHLVLREQKTQKTRQIALEEFLQAHVLEVKRVHGKSDTDLLFHGRYRSRPMSRTTAYRHLRAAAETAGIKGIGVHSLRKTYAVEAYRAYNGDLKKVSALMNHEHVETTLTHYILCNFDLEDFIKKKLLFGAL